MQFLLAMENGNSSFHPQSTYAFTSIQLLIDVQLYSAHYCQFFSFTLFLKMNILYLPEKIHSTYYTPRDIDILKERLVKQVAKGFIQKL